MGRAAGIPEAKLRDINRWRESDAYSEVERLVLEYAEAISATPARVVPELQERLRQHLSEKQLVELTTTVAWENFRARFNRPYGIQPDGFSEGAYCVVPDRHPGSAQSGVDQTSAPS